MLIVIGLMVSGILLGYLFRERNLKFVQKLITWAIFILLFLLGLSVGVNDQIMNNLDTIGIDALCITWGIYKFYFSKG